MKILPFLLAFPLSLFGGVSGTPYSPPAGGGSGSATNVSLSAGTAITIGTNSSSDWSVSVTAKGITTNLLDNTAYGLLMQTGSSSVGISTNPLGNFISPQILPDFMTNYAYIGQEVLQDRIATKATSYKGFAALGIDVTNAALVSCITTSLPGTLIIISNGIHNIGGTNIALSTNCFLIGENMSNTVVYGSARATRLITLTGTTLANFTYTNFSSAGVGSYNGGIGNAAPTTNMNDVVIVNVMLFGMEDTYRYNNGLFDIKLYNCLSFGRWDNLTCSGNDDRTRMFLCNCYFYTEDTCIGNQLDAIRGIRFEGQGTITMNHCIVTNWLGGVPLAPTDSSGIITVGSASAYINESTISVIAAPGVVDQMLAPPYSINSEGGPIILGKGVVYTPELKGSVYFLP